jgi:enamine deaminase RidA (YjgF/YER057c/UK114 family)
MSTITPVSVDFEWDREMPLSQAVRAGNTIYLAGQVSLDRHGKVVGIGDLAAQTRQIFENVRTVLAAAGADLADIVRLTNYFTVDLTAENTRAYWTVRKEYFGDHRPASTGLQVKGLIYPTLLLEVDVIAVLQGSEPR